MPDPVKVQRTQEHVLGLTFENKASLKGLKEELTALANGLNNVISKIEAYESKAKAQNDNEDANKNPSKGISSPGS